MSAHANAAANRLNTTTIPATMKTVSIGMALPLGCRPMLAPAARRALTWINRTRWRGNDARSACLARQRIFGAVVKLADGVAVETLFVHFEHGPEQQDRRHFFDREPDRFRRRIEAAIAGWAITLLAPAGKQLCRRLIVEAGHAVFKHSRGGKASQPRPQALRQS